jgi:lysozyme family protein
MTFDLAVNIVLLHEGDYSNDIKDPGGETKFGISKRSFPNEDIKNMTLDRAKDIYRQYYWEKCECDSLPFYARLMVFDCAVNQGATRAVMFLQRILKVQPDGIIGPTTIKSMAGIGQSEFIEYYAELRCKAYMSNPMWAHYGKGWINRLFDITFKSYRQLVPTPTVLLS